MRTKTKSGRKKAIVRKSRKRQVRFGEKLKGRKQTKRKKRFKPKGNVTPLPVFPSTVSSAQSPAFQQSNRVFRQSKGSTGLPPGINLIGYARFEMGVGESCRLAARAIQSADIPFGIINYETGNYARSSDNSWVSKEMTSPAYKVNLFHINADQMPVACKMLGAKTMRGRFNIGYWHWELPDFPDEFAEGFNHLNEVWVPTTFVHSSVAAKSPVPVVRIPHGIHVDVSLQLNRRSFGLPEGMFLFLCMYDTFSVVSRKNPFAAIEAYKQAVRASGLHAGLVIKVNNPKTEETTRLRQMIEGEPNVFLIDRVLGREETNGLLNVVDCFVSLHRSEGFGLPLAEAMFLGKPVIGTNWSGNTDFMNTANSCAVRYQLVRVGQNYGPYKADQLWAEPDVEHASHYMRKLVVDPRWRNEIAAGGQRTIRTHFSPQTVGAAIRSRLAALGMLSRSSYLGESGEGEK